MPSLHPSFEAHLRTALVRKNYRPELVVSKRDSTSRRSGGVALPVIAGMASGDILGKHFANLPLKTDDVTPDQKLASQRTLAVARYGRIYKRKMPSKWLGYKAPVCKPGYRFCRDCNSAQPVSAFYTNIKRYVCKRHHYQRVRVRFNARMAPADAAPERNAENAWHDLNIFAKTLGYQKLCYDRHDIMDLSRNANIPLGVEPRAVPIDPRIPMRPRNVAIIRRVDFDMLIAVYKVVCSQTVYTLMVQAFNLLPVNADAGKPWAPFDDPSYVRQDCDVAQLLHEESQRPPDRPVYDAVEALRAKANDSNSPACHDSSWMQNQTTHPVGPPPDA